MSSPLPLGFSSTRRQATLFSSPTTKATSPDSSVVTIFRTKRCTLPWLLIWFRSLFWRRLSPSHHSPFVTPECDNSTSKTASCPVVTVISQSSRTMHTCSGGEWDDGRSVIRPQQGPEGISKKNVSMTKNLILILTEYFTPQVWSQHHECSTLMTTNRQSSVVLDFTENTTLNYTQIQHCICV